MEKEESPLERVGMKTFAPKFPKRNKKGKIKLREGNEKRSKT